MIYSKTASRMPKTLKKKIIFVKISYKKIIDT